MALWSAITRITTFDVGVTPAVGQSGDPHRQARTSFLSAIAPTASERRSPALRGSSAHKPLTIAARRCLSTAAAGPSSCPNTDTMSVSSSHAPMMKSRPRTAVSVRRCASGSKRATCASTAMRSFSSERRSQVTARSAIAASISAHACSPWTSRVPQVIVDTSRVLTAPLPNSAATCGKCSRSASAIRICPEARRDPIAIAAPTSAAVQAHGSNTHNARSSSSSVRRRVNSAIAANRRAPAIASCRTPSSIAATNSTSLAAANSESNIRSNLQRGCDKRPRTDLTCG